MQIYIPITIYLRVVRVVLIYFIQYYEFTLTILLKEWEKTLEKKRTKFDVMKLKDF